jgi:hypothetical protein
MRSRCFPLEYYPGEILTEGLSTQVIVLTTTLSGAAGFTLSWFSVGLIFVSP